MFKYSILLIPFLLMGCSQSINGVDENELVSHTYDYKVKNQREYFNNFKKDEYFERIIQEGNDYSEEYLSSLLNRLGNEKGYFYSVTCHKEYLESQTCIFIKTRLDNSLDNRVYQTPLENFVLKNNENSINIYSLFEFKNVYLEKANIPKSNIQVPVNNKQEFILKYSKDELNKNYYNAFDNGAYISILR